MRVPLCGDPAVGKTSLIRTIATGDFSLEEFDTSVPVQVLNGKLTLVDTNCQEDSDRSRVAAYKDADAFLVLFSVISPTSYNSVLTKVRVPLRIAFYEVIAMLRCGQIGGNLARKADMAVSFFFSSFFFSAFSSLAFSRLALSRGLSLSLSISLSLYLSISLSLSLYLSPSA